MQVYDAPGTATKALFDLEQGRSSVAEFRDRFESLVHTANLDLDLIGKTMTSRFSMSCEPSEMEKDEKKHQYQATDKSEVNNEEASHCKWYNSLYL